MNIKSVKRYVKKTLWANLVKDIRDGRALQQIQSLVAGGPYIPWSDSALAASAISAVLNDITINYRSTIIECGGGVSTLFIGSLLKEGGAPSKHLYTIEHDADWIEVLQEMIYDHNVDDWVTLIHAPLRKTALSWNGELWYSEAVLKSELPDKQVDLLLVDGPPGYHSDISHSRYPAGPFFRDMLGDRCAVVIDDINREAEREIIRIWKKELHISFKERLLDGNIAIGIRGNAFNI